MFLQLHARAITAGFSPRRSERGQGALEYMAILVGLIAIIGMLFFFFGDQIEEAGCNALGKVLGERSLPGACKSFVQR